MKTIASLIALGCALAVAAPAAATTFTVSYSYDARPNTFTVLATLTGDQIAGTSSYQITGISGVRTASLSAVGPFNITGLAAVNSFNGNDNILNFFAPRAAGDPSFFIPSAGGIAFTESPGASPVRFFSTAANQRLGMAQENFGTTTSNAFAITITQVADVPEPATWGTMLLGFGLVGAAARRRRRVAVAA